MDELTKVSETLYLITQASYYKKPGDLVRPGEQIPLFIGPCAYCGKGYVPHLPHECPSCDAPLRRVIYFDPPRNRVFARVYWKVQAWKLAWNRAVPEVFRMIWDLASLQHRLVGSAEGKGRVHERTQS
jgi:hypothetical protein